MTLVQTCLGALVLLPLLASALSAVLPAALRRWVGLATAAAVCALTIPVVVHVAAGQVLDLAMGGHQVPLGISLRADGFSVLFLLLATLVGAAVSGHAFLVPESTGAQGPHPGYWPLWLGCWAGLNAVFLAGDLFNTYVGLELVGLTAVGLVALGGAEARKAALRYLFIAVLGSLLFLLAVGLVVSATGTLDIDRAAGVLATQPGAGAVPALAVALLSAGLALKVALVPMHRWLIPAHAGAPAAVSPLLSALVIKASLFVLLRCWLWVAPAGAGPLEALAWLMAVLGVAALVVGSVLALRQDRLKPLVAYSTVAQAGYWFLLLPLVVDGRSSTMAEHAVTSVPEDASRLAALAGTVALVLGHGIAKAGLFLAAGTLQRAYGTDRITELTGAGREHPALVLAMGLCAVGLAGVPFSLAFSGKWQLAGGAVGSGHYWLLVVVVLGTLLSAAYLVAMVAALLVQREDEGDEGDEGDATPRPSRTPTVPLRAQAVPFVLGTLTVATGFTGVWVSGVLEVGAPW